MTDMLIRNPTLGHDLADVLGNHPAALARGHGAVSCIGTNIAYMGHSGDVELNGSVIERPRS
jgi:hypothetical protein